MMWLSFDHNKVPAYRSKSLIDSISLIRRTRKKIRKTDKLIESWIRIDPSECSANLDGSIRRIWNLWWRWRQARRGMKWKGVNETENWSKMCMCVFVGFYECINHQYSLSSWDHLRKRFFFLIFSMMKKRLFVRFYYPITEWMDCLFVGSETFRWWESAMTVGSESPSPSLSSSSSLKIIAGTKKTTKYRPNELSWVLPSFFLTSIENEKITQRTNDNDNDNENEDNQNRKNKIWEKIEIENKVKR